MTDPSRPQPVVSLVGEAAALATRLSAAVKGLGAVLVLVGITTDTEVTQWAEAAGVAVVAAGELASYIYTRVQLAKAARQAAAQVTPLSAPQDDRGVDLVPVDDVAGEHSAEAIIARLKAEGAAS